jgi:hypothetical protein
MPVRMGYTCQFGPVELGCKLCAARDVSHSIFPPKHNLLVNWDEQIINLPWKKLLTEQPVHPEISFNIVINPAHSGYSYFKKINLISTEQIILHLVQCDTTTRKKSLRIS